MKIITCTGYYGTGSSAIIDLVSEYTSVKSLGDYEFRILHDIDGVSDLEFHLVECPNRHNSGHSIKRFEKLVNFYSGNRFAERYEPFFNYQFLKISKDYINELIDFKYNGWWFYDLYDKGKTYYFIKQFQNRFLRKFTKKTNNILKKEKIYCSSPSEKKFIKATKKYTKQLMAAANPDKFNYLGIDQVVPSQNIDRILRYFEDEVFVFVVDRDPRDVYLCEMLKWHANVIPHDPVEFCKWFRYTRSMEKSNKKNVIYLNFEDLIYKYDETISKIESITKLNCCDHISKFSRLNPKKSIINTQIFKRYHDFKDAIALIERELPEFLYPFDSVKDNCILGIEIENKEIF